MFYDYIIKQQEGTKINKQNGKMELIVGHTYLVKLKEGATGAGREYRLGVFKGFDGDFDWEGCTGYQFTFWHHQDVEWYLDRELLDFLPEMVEMWNKEM